MARKAVQDAWVETLLALNDLRGRAVEHVIRQTTSSDDAPWSALRKVPRTHPPPLPPDPALAKKVHGARQAEGAYSRGP